MTFIRRPSPSMAVALLALFAALGGTGYAAVKVTGKNVKNGSLTGKDVKRDSLTGRQVREASLGKVRSAGNADLAARAGVAGRAESAADASRLAGRSPSDFAPARPEPVRVVGTSGQPAFAPGWEPADPSDERPGLFKDLSGVVHLRGAAARVSGTEDLIFTLPAGYRPKREQYFITYGGPTQTNHLEVLRNGEIRIINGNDAFVGLNGISFLAEQ